MQTLLVVGSSLAGVVIGAALDPVGQRLAEASQAEEEARRAEALVDEEGASPAEAARMEGTSDEDRPSATPRLAATLVPAGPVPVRTASAGLVCGVLFGATADHFGRDVIVAPFCLFFALLVSVSVTDLTHRLVPRRLVYPGSLLVAGLLVVTAAVDHRWHSFSGSAIAGAAAFALFFAVWWFVPRGMGFGDVRLAGVIGFVVGFLSVLHAYVAFLAGFLVGLVFGLLLLLATGSGRRTAIPFAPSLSVGAVIGVLWGSQIAHALFHAT